MTLVSFSLILHSKFYRHHQADFSELAKVCADASGEDDEEHGDSELRVHHGLVDQDDFAKSSNEWILTPKSYLYYTLLYHSA